MMFFAVDFLDFEHIKYFWRGDLFALFILDNMPILVTYIYKKL